MGRVGSGGSYHRAEYPPGLPSDRPDDGGRRMGGLDFRGGDLEVRPPEFPHGLQVRPRELKIRGATDGPAGATWMAPSADVRIHRDSKYDRCSASNPTMSATKRTNPPATTPKGMGAIKRTTGPNPTTFANATGQAQSCRRRIPIPVPNATMAAKPLRKAWPAPSGSECAHSTATRTQAIQAAAGALGVRRPPSAIPVKTARITVTIPARKTAQRGAACNVPNATASARRTSPPRSRLRPTNHRMNRSSVGLNVPTSAWSG